ncbi:MAG: hypothetical protein ACPGED_07625 [Flavobacteriales bacterium]
MKNLVDSIKNYFARKENGENTGSAPEGMCPTCWGHSEYDGQYYDVVKDKHLTKEGKTYESWISKIVDEHVSRTHKHGTVYTCITCDKEIK